MKNNMVNVRFTDMDYYMVKSVCDKFGFSVSDFVRSAVLRVIDQDFNTLELAKEYYNSKA